MSYAVVCCGPIAEASPAIARFARLNIFHRAGLVGKMPAVLICKSNKPACALLTPDKLGPRQVGREVLNLSSTSSDGLPI